MFCFIGVRKRVRVINASQTGGLLSALEGIYRPEIYIRTAWETTCKTRRQQSHPPSLLGAHRMSEYMPCGAWLTSQGARYPTRL